MGDCPACPIPNEEWTHDLVFLVPLVVALCISAIIAIERSDIMVGVGTIENCVLSRLFRVRTRCTKSRDPRKNAFVEVMTDPLGINVLMTPAGSARCK